MADAQAIYDEGMQLLQDGDVEGALAKAARLEELRFSGAFELAALAHLQRGETAEAAAVLERGVGLAPDVWLNWQLLGNARSDLGRFDEAAAAYDRAADCSEAYVPSIDLNRAVLALRRGDDEEARDRSGALLEVDDEALAASAHATWIGARARLGEDAAALAGELTEKIQESDSASSQQLWQLRELVGRSSPNARAWRLVLHAQPGLMLVAEDVLGAYTCVDVVADTPEEGAALVRPLVAEELVAKFEVDEVEDLGPRAEDPCGVYALRGFTFYSSNDED